VLICLDGGQNVVLSGVRGRTAYVLTAAYLTQTDAISCCSTVKCAEHGRS